MGLDMYSYRVKGGADSVDLADDVNINMDSINRDQSVFEPDFFYWRKHANLHGWMYDRYLSKGGTADTAEFNCTPFRLRADDIDALEADLNEAKLPHTTGFFFGASRPEDQELDRQFIAKARAAIATGDAILYDSWW